MHRSLLLLLLLLLRSPPRRRQRSRRPQAQSPRLSIGDSNPADMFSRRGYKPSAAVQSQILHAKELEAEEAAKEKGR